MKNWKEHILDFPLEEEKKLVEKVEKNAFELEVGEKIVWQGTPIINNKSKKKNNASVPGFINILIAIVVILFSYFGFPHTFFFLLIYFSTWGCYHFLAKFFSSQIIKSKKYFITSNRLIFQNKEKIKSIPLHTITSMQIERNYEYHKVGTIFFKIKNGNWQNRPYFDDIKNVGETYTLLEQTISKNRKRRQKINLENNL